MSWAGQNELSTTEFATKKHEAFVCITIYCSNNKSYVPCPCKEIQITRLPKSQKDRKKAEN